MKQELDNHLYHITPINEHYIKANIMSSSMNHNKQNGSLQFKPKRPIASFLFNHLIKTPKQSKLSPINEVNYLKTSSSRVSSFDLAEENDSTSSFHSSKCSDKSRYSIIFFIEEKAKDFKSECESEKQSCLKDRITEL